MNIKQILFENVLESLKYQRTAMRGNRSQCDMQVHLRVNPDLSGCEVRYGRATDDMLAKDWSSDMVRRGDSLAKLRRTARALLLGCAVSAWFDEMERQDTASAARGGAL